MDVHDVRAKINKKKIVIFFLLYLGFGYERGQTDDDCAVLACLGERDGCGVSHIISQPRTVKLSGNILHCESEFTLLQKN
jgi:hypothetical protein